MQILHSSMAGWEYTQRVKVLLEICRNGLNASIRIKSMKFILLLVET